MNLPLTWKIYCTFHNYLGNSSPHRIVPSVFYGNEVGIVIAKMELIMMLIFTENIVINQKETNKLDSV